MNERRAVPRVEPRKPLSARVKTFMPARIVDISSRGAQIELATSLRPEVPCDLRIKLEPRDIVVRAIVRRCRAWGFGLDERDQRVLLYRAGIEFEEPAPEALTEMLGAALAANGRAGVPATKGPASPTAEPANAEPAKETDLRAPRSEGPVKIRVSAEHIRKVLRGPHDKGKR
jgi:hypothetical protein